MTSFKNHSLSGFFKTLRRPKYILTDLVSVVKMTLYQAYFRIYEDV
jgi:hypothetical protein